MQITAPAPDAQHILNVWRSATDSQRERGMAWYDDANRTARRMATQYGVSLEVAAGVIAATSPNNSWAGNVKVAERILATGDTTQGYLGVGLSKARRILDGEDVESVLTSRTYFKVLNFYRGIVSRGTDGVCVDRHAWDVATGTRHADKAHLASEETPLRPSVSGKRYSVAVETYNAAASEISRIEGRTVSACEVQAVTWIVWRARYWSEGAFDVQETMPISVQFEDMIETNEWADMILAYLTEEVAA
jgi:hypothetical protein